MAHGEVSRSCVSLGLGAASLLFRGIESRVRGVAASARAFEYVIVCSCRVLDGLVFATYLWRAIEEVKNGLAIMITVQAAAAP